MYFSDRQYGQRTATEDEFSDAAWGGVVAYIMHLIRIGSFGRDFPLLCPDGPRPIGTDERLFVLALCGEVPGIEWPLHTSETPDTLSIIDVIEFCALHVAAPAEDSYHKYFDHWHLEFDGPAGLRDFCEKINLLFSRNGLRYSIDAHGLVRRVAETPNDEDLLSAVFETGDDTLDGLLTVARDRFFSPKSGGRQEALEKLWDSWERLKSLGGAGDKKQATRALLDSATSVQTFRDFLETEARSLTDAGNKFYIRHSEQQQIQLDSDEARAYLFRRLFSLIWLLLRKSS